MSGKLGKASPLSVVDCMKPDLHLIIKPMVSSTSEKLAFSISSDLMPPATD